MDGSEKFFLRDIIGNYMTTIGQYKRVLMVNADLAGTCRNRNFIEQYPERSFNVGIAEQNMISFSAGLAREGFMPFAFSMAPFISMRACEQCRTDVAYGNLNVRLIAPYAGCSGGISGATHWAIEDCAIMCAMPNMTVLEPCDPTQAQRMLDKMLTHEGPLYLRCSVEPTVSIYDEKYEFVLGHADTARMGNDGAFICAGITVKYAVEAADIIKAQTGKSVRVVDMHTIKPLDRMAVIDAASTGRVVVAQDHSVIGGLGQQVAMVLAEEGLSVRFANLGIEDKFVAMAHPPYLYKKFGYDTDGLVQTMTQLFDVC